VVLQAQRRKRLYGADIARDMRVSEEVLEELVGFPLPQPEKPKATVTRPHLRLVA
jgi:hypothetical protein